jgi:hypothetical protein
MESLRFRETIATLSFESFQSERSLVSELEDSFSAGLYHPSTEPWIVI